MLRVDLEMKQHGTVCRSHSVGSKRRWSSINLPGELQLSEFIFLEVPHSFQGMFVEKSGLGICWLSQICSLKSQNTDEVSRYAVTVKKVEVSVVVGVTQGLQDKEKHWNNKAVLRQVLASAGFQCCALLKKKKSAQTHFKQEDLTN